MVRRCLEFEAQHRGTRTGMGALRWVIAYATHTVIDAKDDPRILVVPILRDHYVAHPDVDLLLDAFNLAFPLGEAEPLLRKIAAESPHDYVRVAAQYELAKMLVFWDAMMHSPNVTMSDETRKELAQAPAAFRKEAEGLLDRIATDFRQVRPPDREWTGPRWIRLVDDPQDQLRHAWSIPEAAGFLHFQLTRLGIGQLAPVLKGTDLFHRPVRLSDFAGKVVVLTLTTSFGDDRDMYDRCKRLLDEFKGRPVVYLSVLAVDSGGSHSILDIVREMGITWPVVRDPHGDNRLAYQWCHQEIFTAAYVIDQRGFIRFFEQGSRLSSNQDTVSAALSEQVRELLKAQQP